MIALPRVMLKRLVLLLGAVGMLVVTAPRAAHSALACDIGQVCSVTIDIPNCASPQVDFNVPRSSWHTHWTTNSGASVSPWGGECADDSGNALSAVVLSDAQHAGRRLRVGGERRGEEASGYRPKKCASVHKGTPA